MRNYIYSLTAFFYRPFKKYMSLQMFRYAFSGGLTAGTGIIAYFIAYNFILHQHDMLYKFWPFSPANPLLVTAPIAALGIELCITFPLGFLLNRYIVFTTSTLRGRVQLFRYGSTVATNILLNYALIKLMVEAFGFYPTIAKIGTTGIVTIFSYLSSRYFSFREPREL